MKRNWLVVLALIAVSVVASLRGMSRTKEEGERDVVRLKQAMPALDGKSLTATLVEVTYTPGAGSEPHSHPCPVIGYVIEGTIESQVAGQPFGRYEAGQTFYEEPNGVHAISRNPSKDKPARLLAYLLCDKPGPLTTPPNGK